MIPPWDDSWWCDDTAPRLTFSLELWSTSLHGSGALQRCLRDETEGDKNTHLLKQYTTPYRQSQMIMRLEETTTLIYGRSCGQLLRVGWYCFLYSQCKASFFGTRIGPVDADDTRHYQSYRRYAPIPKIFGVVSFRKNEWKTNSSTKLGGKAIQTNEQNRSGR